MRVRAVPCPGLFWGSYNYAIDGPVLKFAIVYHLKITEPLTTRANGLAAKLQQLGSGTWDEVHDEVGPAVQIDNDGERGGAAR